MTAAPAAVPPLAAAIDDLAAAYATRDIARANARAAIDHQFAALIGQRQRAYAAAKAARQEALPHPD